MTRRRAIRTAGLLGIAAVVASGCGGGGDAATTPPAGTTPAPTPSPTPAADPNAPLTADGGAAAGGAATGELGATAEIPDLSGGDVGGGLGAPSGGNGLFEAGAIDLADALERDKAAETTTQPDFGTTIGGNTTTTPTTPSAPDYSGAKLYVDGIIHDVQVDGAFPSDNPVFRLVKVSGGSVEVELIAGEFTSGGGSGVLIDKGELVSLVNASEQLTYRVKYLRPISGSSGVTF
jgi:hypothetical protein